MKLVVLGCLYCGTLTPSLDGVCEQCQLERSPDALTRAIRRRPRVRTTLPRNRVA